MSLAGLRCPRCQARCLPAWLANCNAVHGIVVDANATLLRLLAPRSSARARSQCTLLACLLVGLLARSPYRFVRPSAPPSPPLARMSEMAAGGNPNLHGERQGGVAGGQEERAGAPVDPWLAAAAAAPPMRLTECDVTARHSLRLPPSLCLRLGGAERGGRR